MAIDDSQEKSNPTAELNRRYCNIAGAVSTVLGLGGIAGLIVHLLGHSPQSLSPEAAGMYFIWIVLSVIVAAAGGFLLRGRKSALWVLLVIWLIVTVCAVLQGFGWMLWGSPPLLVGLVLPFAPLVVLLEMLIGGVMAFLLVAATTSGSRDRYGAMVGVSVGAAVAVVLVVNMIAFYAPYQRDFETLGRFGLSERSRRILKDVNQPIRISAVYAAAMTRAETEQPGKNLNQTRNYLRRVMELLEEMHRYNDKVQVTDASGDAARSRLMGRLQHRQAAKTGKQETLLKKALKGLPELLEQLAAQQEFWAQTPPKSYLWQWDLGGGLQDALGRMAKNLKTVEKKIRREMATTPLPDYVRMLNDLLSQLRASREELDAHTKLLKRLGNLPATVKTNAPKVLKSVDDSVRAMQEVRKILGKGKASPRNPAKKLNQLAVDLGKAAKKIRDAATELDTVAGKDKRDIELISVSRAWMIEIDTVLGKVRTTRSRLFDAIAQQLDTLRAQTALHLSDANEAAQKRFILDLRLPVDKLIASMKTNKSAVETGLRQLETVDAFSRNVLERAQKDHVFSKISEHIRPILDEGEKLKAPEQNALPPDLSGRDIIVIEAGEKVEVVRFDEVFPMLIEQAPSLSQNGGSSRRFFNGDAVLGSRILGLTQSRPFARVLMTYLRPTAPKGVNPMLFRPPTGEISVSQLQTVRKRLEEANFKVQDWNLAEPFPAAETQPVSPPLPTVLLVLPPAPVTMPMGPGGPSPGSGFGPEHIEKIRQAIDNGATGIFLGTFLSPRFMGFGPPIPQGYKLNEYLRKDWGMDVKTSFMLIEGIPSDEPGKYRVKLINLYYMPLSGFSAQPVGKPLQGRELVWPRICPIALTPRDERPAGVEIHPLLEIPDTMTNVWGSGNVIRLFQQIENSPGSPIAPNYDQGDLKVPLMLAVAAARSGQKEQNIAASRIVVLGLGAGLKDRYLNSPIPVLTAKGGLDTKPPPRANADLVVNSAYWLVGLERYIAAGPVSIAPVREMSPAVRSSIWAFCVVLLPLGILAVGCVIMMMRKR